MRSLLPLSTRLSLIVVQFAHAGKCPPERIAKHPLANRDDSKLLFYADGEIRDLGFKQVTDQLTENALLVFNNTRVVQARLLFEKTPGAKPIEVFCLEPIGQDVESAMGSREEVLFQCLVGNAKRWNDGLVLDLNLSSQLKLSVEKIERRFDDFIIRKIGMFNDQVAR